MVHRDRSVGIAVGGDPDAKNGEVDSECENGRSQEEQKDPEEDSPESFAKFMGRVGATRRIIFLRANCRPPNDSGSNDSRA